MTELIFDDRKEAMEYFLEVIYKDDEENSELVKLSFEKWLAEEEPTIISEIPEEGDFSGSTNDDR